MTTSERMVSGHSAGAPSVPRTGRRRRKVPRVLTSPVGYLMTLPALLIFGVFTIGPTVYTFYISLFNWNSLNPARSRYLGLSNYQELFTADNPPFLTSAGNSLYFTVAMVIGGTAISWNSFIWPSIMAPTDPSVRPIELGLYNFLQSAGTDYTGLCAAVTFTTPPVLVIFLLLQRYFITGAFSAAGGVRG